tara:strand:- start:21 stop:401 length:381 start_codon:yes stop_codon:yes gene_type:complete
LEKQKKRPTKVNKDTFPPFSPPITTKPAKSWTAVILMVPVMGMIYAEIYNQVMLNFSSVSYQSGWHFVAVVGITPFIYFAGGIVGMVVFFIKKDGKKGLKWFAIGSQIFMAIAGSLLIFGAIITSS